MFYISRGKNTFFNKCPNNGLVSDKKYIVFFYGRGGEGGSDQSLKNFTDFFFFNEGFPYPGLRVVESLVESYCILRVLLSHVESPVRESPLWRAGRVWSAAPAPAWPTSPRASPRPRWGWLACYYYYYYCYHYCYYYYYYYYCIVCIIFWKLWINLIILRDNRTYVYAKHIIYIIIYTYV